MFMQAVDIYFNSFNKVGGKEKDEYSMNHLNPFAVVA